MQSGDALFEFQKKEPLAIAWMCLFRDDLTAVLGNDNLDCWFQGFPSKGRSPHFRADAAYSITDGGKSGSGGDTATGQGARPFIT